jgi:hypothetical protein
MRPAEPPAILPNTAPLVGPLPPGSSNQKMPPRRSPAALAAIALAGLLIPEISKPFQAEESRFDAAARVRAILAPGVVPRSSARSERARAESRAPLRSALTHFRYWFVKTWA